MTKKIWMILLAILLILCGLHCISSFRLDYANYVLGALMFVTGVFVVVDK